MAAKLHARVLHSLARCDVFDGVGRIYLGEARQQLAMPELTQENIVDLWREYYPDESAEPRQTNLVLIYFDGKDCKNIRSLRAPSNGSVEPPAGNPDLILASKTPRYMPADFKGGKPADNIIAAEAAYPAEEEPYTEEAL